MKIQFSGPHCTGKTTLAKKLAEELKIPYIKSMKTQPIWEEASIPLILDREAKILSEYIYEFTANESGVFDRGIEDWYAYTVYWMTRKARGFKAEHLRIVETWFEIAKQVCKADVYFYVFVPWEKAEKWMLSRGLRYDHENNYDYWKYVSEMIWELLPNPKFRISPYTKISTIRWMLSRVGL